MSEEPRRKWDRYSAEFRQQALERMKTCDNARRKWDRYSAEFRQQALERMKTCDNVKALAKELGVARQQLYWWKQRADQGAKPREPGAAEDPRESCIRKPWIKQAGACIGLTLAQTCRHRRIRELMKKVAELEGVIGQKTLELDFFAGALRRVEESRQKKGMSGETASTVKSASGCNRKAD